MIHSDVFYRSFDAGFAASGPASHASRVKGKPSRYDLHSRAGVIRAWFRVNPRSSAIPYQPGEFWPELVAPPGIRDPERTDDGTLSWYQFTTTGQVAEIQALRQKVVGSIPVRGSSDDPMLEITGSDAGTAALWTAHPPEPRLPHTRLHYYTAADAELWGRLFGSQLPSWLEAFAASPETLEQHMWRVHWTDEA